MVVVTGADAVVVVEATVVVGATVVGVSGAGVVVGVAGELGAEVVLGVVDTVGQKQRQLMTVNAYTTTTTT